MIRLGLSKKLGKEEVCCGAKVCEIVHLLNRVPPGNLGSYVLTWASDIELL